MKQLSRTLSIIGGILAILAGTAVNAQPTIEWGKSLHGRSGDYGYQVQPTSDKGFIIIGSTHAADIGGVGGADIWLVKTDSLGDTAWSRVYGGSSPDVGFYVEQTADGGYILTGYTMSSGAGERDLILIKTDAAGDTTWTRVYGGTGSEAGCTVHQLTDNGYILAGYTSSFGPGGSGANCWMMRTDELGDTLWSATYGSTEGDWAQSVEATADGGFILAGHSFAYASNRSAVYLVKTDANGGVDWIEHYIGAGTEFAGTVHQTQDHGYIISGWTTSYGAGGSDIYLLRTDSAGVELWHKAYGGVAEDRSEGYGGVIELVDGGFALVGRTESFGSGGKDIWLLRTDAAGDTLWSALIGGAGDEDGRSVIRLPNDHFVVAGFSSSETGTPEMYLGSVEYVVSSVRALDESSLPEEFMLKQNYPNPFNSVTAIRFGLPEKSHITIDIFDILGRNVTTLVDTYLSAGNYLVEWDGTDRRGESVATGVYFYRLKANDFVQSQKMVLLK